MKKNSYLFDTHALIFWCNRESVSDNFIIFFDKQEQKGNIFMSSISFWEIALLVKRGKIEMRDVHAWKNEILNNTNIELINPTASEMIDSTLLPDHHKDPFDRLLIAQASCHQLLLVTKDIYIQKYPIQTFWM
ncbi:MAG: type II toxin-antitoxin system VapC family toxin [Thermodesulfobacteriota bacterium]|nr:type II toxin-antitoxin system VapC family toxin [Thermodesulfobacteriota bacterium]